MYTDVCIVDDTLIHVCLLRLYMSTHEEEWRVDDVIVIPPSLCWSRSPPDLPKRQLQSQSGSPHISLYSVCSGCLARYISYACMHFAHIGEPLCFLFWLSSFRSVLLLDMCGSETPERWIVMQESLWRDRCLIKSKRFSFTTWETMGDEARLNSYLKITMSTECPLSSSGSFISFIATRAFHKEVSVSLSALQSYTYIIWLKDMHPRPSPTHAYRYLDISIERERGVDSSRVYQVSTVDVYTWSLSRGTRCCSRERVWRIERRLTVRKRPAASCLDLSLNLVNLPLIGKGSQTGRHFFSDVPPRGRMCVVRREAGCIEGDCLQRDHRQRAPITRESYHI